MKTTTLPLRERRHQQAIHDLARLERQRDEALDKLARITAKLKALRRSIERYERTPKPTAVETDHMPEAVFEKFVEDHSHYAREPAPLPMGKPLDRQMVKAVTEAIGHRPVNPVKPDDDFAVPTFLRRAGPIGNKTPADLAAAAAIEAELSERKRAKALGRVAKLKAKKSGETKRMPLQGKAALEAIRKGSV